MGPNQKNFTSFWFTFYYNTRQINLKTTFRSEKSSVYGMKLFCFAFSLSRNIFLNCKLLITGVACLRERQR